MFQNGTLLIFSVGSAKHSATSGLTGFPGFLSSLIKNESMFLVFIRTNLIGNTFPLCGSAGPQKNLLPCGPTFVCGKYVSAIPTRYSFLSECLMVAGPPSSPSQSVSLFLPSKQSPAISLFKEELHI